MESVAKSSERWRNLLGKTVESVARETGFVQRRSKVTGSVFVQTLVFGWLSNPESSVEDLAQTAAALGTDVSAQGLCARFSERAARFVQEVLGNAVRQAVASEPMTSPVLSRFNGVYVYDGSTITLPGSLKGLWPGCGGSSEKNTEAALKVQMRFELLTGEMLGPLLQSGRAHDLKAPTLEAPLPKGSLRLADTGFFDQSRLRALSEEGVYWLSRVPAQLTVQMGAGESMSLAKYLTGSRGRVVDQWAFVGRGRLAARILAERLPQQVADTAKRRLRRKYRNWGMPLTRERLALCEWVVYVTNVPEEVLSVAEAGVLYRVRWQIEVLFKVWKSHGRVAAWRSENPWRILCEVYAKLLARLLSHWLVVLGAWKHPDRSLWKAEKTIQRFALSLAAAFREKKMFVQAVKAVVACLEKGCRLNKSRRHPRTFQRLLALENGGLT